MLRSFKRIWKSFEEFKTCLQELKRSLKEPVTVFKSFQNLNFRGITWFSKFSYQISHRYFYAKMQQELHASSTLKRKPHEWRVVIHSYRKKINVYDFTFSGWWKTSVVPFSSPLHDTETPSNNSYSSSNKCQVARQLDSCCRVYTYSSSGLRGSDH